MESDDGELLSAIEHDLAAVRPNQNVRISWAFVCTWDNAPAYGHPDEVSTIYNSIYAP